MIKFVIVDREVHFELARKLFREYAAELSIDLAFQDFEKELLELETQYASPGGSLILAFRDSRPAGCVGLRKLSGRVCELKRMYVHRASRGTGLGGALLKRALEVGKILGYEKMRLDTLDTMQTAIGLYRKMGFYEIDAYRFNPIAGAKFFEAVLKD